MTPLPVLLDIDFDNLRSHAKTGEPLRGFTALMHDGTRETPAEWDVVDPRYFHHAVDRRGPHERFSNPNHAEDLLFYDMGRCVSQGKTLTQINDFIRCWLSRCGYQNMSDETEKYRDEIIDVWSFAYRNSQARWKLAP